MVNWLLCGLESFFPGNVCWGLEIPYASACMPISLQNSGNFILSFILSTLTNSKDLTGKEQINQQVAKDLDTNAQKKQKQSKMYKIFFINFGNAKKFH